MKKVLKVLLIIFLVIIGIALIGIITLKVKSPGKLDLLTNEQGKVITNSITEKNETEIGGITQKFFIRSENPENPVILFLHGGPGSPELMMVTPREKSERLEKYFTVCYWDQRGAGMTFSSSTDASTMTVPQMVEDAHEMTQYLKKRFGQEKIYLMGHSWGSFLGIKTIEKYPEDYLAYFGIGQVTNQHKSEVIAFEYMLNHAKEIDDQDAIKRLSEFDVKASNFPTNKYLLMTRTPLMNRYGIGIMHANFTDSDIAKDMINFKGYTFGEKINFLRGSMFSLENLFHRVIEDNLFESSIRFEVPVYVIHGFYDYQVSHSLAKEYIERIEAPKKELITFENCAHSPNVEEPERFVKTVREITEQIKLKPDSIQ